MTRDEERKQDADGDAPQKQQQRRFLIPGIM